MITYFKFKNFSLLIQAELSIFSFYLNFYLAIFNLVQKMTKLCYSTKKNIN